MGLRAFTRGLRRLVHWDEENDALSEEVAHYIGLASAEYERSGLSPDEAMRRARLDFGGTESAKEAVRGAGWDALIDSIRRDITYGIRALARTPAFAIVALATIALGIGVSTTMFSVVNAVLLRPLPYHAPDRLALVWTDDVRRGLHEEATAYRTIQDWRADTHAFDAVAYFSTRRVAFRTNGDARGRTRYAFVAGNLFATLGVAPVRGRVIMPSDEENAENVVVISYAFWQRELGGDPDVLNRTVRTDDDNGSGALRVVGVMPPQFYFPDTNTELWTPATTYWRFSRESTERFPSWARRWTALVRLRPDVSFADARADLARLGDRLATLYPSDVSDFPGFRTNVVSMLDHVTGRTLQLALWVLLGAVGLVLLVACANVANLLLARGATRQRELALRRALGADRGRLIRQLLSESMVLALGSGAVGVVAALFGVRVLGVVAASRVPRIDEITVDGRVLMFALTASVVAGLLFGIMPALRVSRADANDVLKEGDGPTTFGGRRLRRTRGVLVLAECSVAIVLLTGAGLLLRSLNRVTAIAPGFDPRDVLVIRIEYPSESAPTAEERTQTSTIAQARARARDAREVDLLARVKALPSVEAVGFSDDMFIAGQGHQSITIPGRAADGMATGELNQGTASADFFRTLRVPLVRGRYLSHDDVLAKIRALWSPVKTDMSLADKERVAVAEPVVVNETFAHRFFPGEDPIGKRFCMDPTNKTYWYEIVGVVGDMHRQGLEHRVIPEFFGPHLVNPHDRADLLVRTRENSAAVVPDLRRAIAAAIPGVTIVSVTAADRAFSDFTAARAFQTWLLSGFAALALLLAAIGIYGVVHYAVAERTREIGLRVALGASPGRLMREVMLEGMRMPVAGIVFGVLVALATTRVLSHLLFGIGATDPATFAGVLLVLVVVAGLACLLPARRATRVDPITALRD